MKVKLVFRSYFSQNVLICCAFSSVLDKKKKAFERLKEQLMKLEVQETDKEENKTIALGTSKLNYLDPRISVAWCVSIR